MTRPRVIDCFPFHSELDLLQCRLEELHDSVDHFVLVEAHRNHQDVDKPLYYAENAARFKPWADKIVHVIAGPMPSLAENPDHWSREHAQREYIGDGLTKLAVSADDIILQSDLDEIPRALQTRNARTSGLIAFEMSLHCFKVDWVHPQRWRGTVAGRAGFVHGLGAQCFAKMRNARNTVACPPPYRDAGWHLSWLGDTEAAKRKLEYFCHTEISDEVTVGLKDDFYASEGWHVDGHKMQPVEVDETWPRYIYERRCPANWFRS